MTLFVVKYKNEFKKPVPYANSLKFMTCSFIIGVPHLSPKKASMSVTKVSVARL